MGTINKFKSSLLTVKLFSILFILSLLSSCEEDLPGIGSIEDQTPPTASFTFSQLEPTNYLEVTFSNASISSTDYLWDFGDGTSSVEKEPVHIYTADGSYTVKLTSSDKLNVGSIKEMVILLTAPAPIASFTFVADTADDKIITFKSTSSFATSYTWDFGDGNTGTGDSTINTYAVDSTYMVTLIASNANGLMDTATRTVEIGQAQGVVVSITNPSFDDEPVKDDNRTVWRNTMLEADATATLGIGSMVVQMTTTERTGTWAGKLPTAENSSKPRRCLYQAITVNPNRSYTITGWVRNKASAVGSTLTFEIYDAPFNTAATIGNAANILRSEVFNASTGHDTNSWTSASITFNSGSSTEIVLFITNDHTLTATDSESFLDDFSIVEM